MKKRLLGFFIGLFTGVSGVSSAWGDDGYCRLSFKTLDQVGNVTESGESTLSFPWRAIGYDGFNNRLLPFFYDGAKFVLLPLGSRPRLSEGQFIARLKVLNSPNAKIDQIEPGRMTLSLGIMSQGKELNSYTSNHRGSVSKVSDGIEMTVTVPGYGKFRQWKDYYTTVEVHCRSYR